MRRVLRVLRAWTVLSIPIGILVGKLLKANRRATTRPADPRSPTRAVIADRLACVRQIAPARASSTAGRR